MYIFRNALKSITRSKGRNILIGIIVVVMASASCISLAIHHSAQALEDQGVTMQNLKATISVDREKLLSSLQGKTRQEMRAAMQKYQALSLDELQKYAKSSSVSKFNYSTTSSMNAGGTLEAYDPNSTSTSTTDTTNSSGNNQNNNGNQNNGGNGGNGGGGDRGPMGMRGDFNIIGFSSEEAMTPFVNGKSKITAGQLFDLNSASYQVVISNELAKLNNLVVGDKITLTNPNVTTETYEFTITGIFTNTDTNSSTDGGIMFSASQDAANQIYTSYPAIQAVIQYSKDHAEVTTDDNGNEFTTALRARDSGTYILPNMTAYTQFQQDVVTLGLDPNYMVTSSDLNNYQESLVPLQNLSQFASTLLWIVLIVGAIILIVLNMFNIRERKYEIGVLTAIGMKKYKVATQLVSELFIVTFIALVIGSAIGSVASVPTANALLANQISAQQAQIDQQNENFGRPGQGGDAQNRGGGWQNRGGGFGNFFGMNNQSVSYIDNIDAVVNFDIIWQLLGIGVLLTFLSSLAALIVVMRYEPLKILANRS